MTGLLPCSCQSRPIVREWEMTRSNKTECLQFHSEVLRKNSMAASASRASAAERLGLTSRKDAVSAVRHVPAA